MEKQRRPILGTGRECRSRPVRVPGSRLLRPGPRWLVGHRRTPHRRASFHSHEQITARVVNLEVEVIRQVDVVSSEQTTTDRPVQLRAPRRRRWLGSRVVAAMQPPSPLSQQQRQSRVGGSLHTSRGHRGDRSAPSTLEKDRPANQGQTAADHCKRCW